MSNSPTYLSDSRPEPEAVRNQLRKDPRLPPQRRSRLGAEGRDDHPRGGDRCPRGHADDPGTGGDDRQAPFRRLRADPRLQLPRAHACLGRPGRHGGRGLLRPFAGRQYHQHPPRPRREPGQGDGRHPADDRRATAPARARIQGDEAWGTGRGCAGGARLPHDLRTVRQGRRVLPGPRRLDAHRRLHRRAPGGQRDRRRRRSDCDRRGHGQPIPAAGQRRVLLRGRWRLCERRGAGGAQFRGAEAVHESLCGRSPVRPADHLPGLQQSLRDDPPDRRRGYGNRQHGPARRGIRGQQPPCRDRQWHGCPRGPRGGPPGDQALPGRQGPGPPGCEVLPLLGPFAQRSAQRVPHEGGRGGVEGDRPDRGIQKGPSGRQGDRRIRHRRGGETRRRPQRPGGKAGGGGGRSPGRGRPHLHVHGHQERDGPRRIRQRGRPGARCRRSSA